MRALDNNISGFIFIENIGNLICPTDFDLGETLRLVIASVPEGDDKPAKYPGIFAKAGIIVLNKADLLPQVEFDLDYFKRTVKALNKNAIIIESSAKTGQGMEELVNVIARSSTRR